MINWCRCQLVDGTTLPPLSVGLLAKGHTTYPFYHYGMVDEYGLFGIIGNLFGVGASSLLTLCLSLDLAFELT